MRFLVSALILLWAMPGFAQMASPPAAPGSSLVTTSGSGMALEGDLVSVNGSVVRLWGIDAPEVGQTCETLRHKSYDCFTISKNALANIIGKNQITCYIRGSDVKGQQVGTCAVQELDLAALMVRAGWALSFHSLSPQYARLEGEAQAAKRGLWNGFAETPWSWRTSQLVKSRNKP